MRAKLLEHYERELGYIRQLGAEFATKYPAVAGRLLLEPDRCADPHVERLIEAFSFLAARIHLRLDDDFPELTQGFLDVVYPHYLRPVPSMTIVEFLADESSGNAGSEGLIPAGTEITTKRSVNGVPCTFRTGYPVSLWPVRIEQCSWRRPEQIPSPPRVRDAASALRIEFKAEHDIVLSKLALNDLVFYLSGERSTTLPLYEMLSHNLIEIVVRNPLRHEIHPFRLSKRNLQPIGFAPEEGVLPYTARSFQGHRILQEYFSFPEKFLFFKMEGLRVAMEAVQASERLEILLYVRQPEQTARMHGLEIAVSAETLRLFCTPAINLFERTAEPIILTHTKTEYPISVDTRSRGNVEIFSIDSVLATNPSRRTTVTLPPLFEQRFEGVKGIGGTYWKSTRRYSHLQPNHPSDVYLSTVDQHGLMMQANAEILGVKCICTNHNLPSMITMGSPEGDFNLPGAAGGARIQALHRPTLSYAAPFGEGQTWNLISLLSLNHLSLGEAGLGALQEILRLHDFTRSPQLEKQISGIANLRTQRHVAVMQGEFGSAAVKGIRVEMGLDESHFPDGAAYLFSAVLDRFLGLYASMNSFSQLVVRTDARKEVLGEWPPRAGTQALL